MVYIILNLVRGAEVILTRVIVSMDTHFNRYLQQRSYSYAKIFVSRDSDRVARDEPHH